MAFVHHPRSRPARERQLSPTRFDAAAARSTYRRSSQDTAQDWSIVFPGRVKEKPASAQGVEEERSEQEESAGSSSLDPFAHDQQRGLELTLPPLHDGTGRFTGTSEPSISPGPSPADDIASLRSPLSPNSELYTDSVFSASDSHDDADADGEVGFGSGSDFESDAIASVPSGAAAARRPRASRRGSRLSAAESSAASGRGRSRPRALDDVEEGSFVNTTVPTHSSIASSLGASRAWSWLSGNQTLASAVDSIPDAASTPSLSSQLEPASGRRFHLRAPEGGRALSVISTSDSEQDGPQQEGLASRPEDPHLTCAGNSRSTLEDDLACSNHAQSAGLVSEGGPDMLWRHPKRRHRNAALGRSSKRSNTSQSQSAVHNSPGESHRSCAVLSEGGVSGRRARRRDAFGGSQRSVSGARHTVRGEATSNSNKLVRKLLRKIFDLEPDVLDSVFGNDAALLQQSSNDRGGASSISSALSRRPDGPGFPHERGLDAPLVTVSAPPPFTHAAMPRTGNRRMHLLLDGREIEELSDAADDDDDAASGNDGSATPRPCRLDASRWPGSAADLASSPLFDLSRTVQGERTPAEAAAGIGLTFEALSRRRTGSDSSVRSADGFDSHKSVFEPTTIEALQAFVNSVMPVPMPFRILGALARSLGWTGSGWGATSGRGDSAAHGDDGEGHEGSSVSDERRYRYDRLLSARQARAWSRQYRGIQLANDQEDDTSMDVPACWRGNEHPALAGDLP